jgi:hypothetical protein
MHQVGATGINQPANQSTNQYASEFRERREVSIKAGWLFAPQ